MSRHRCRRRGPPSGCGDHLVDVAHVGTPGPEVEELVDAGRQQEAHRAAQEGAVLPRDLDHRRAATA